MTTDETGGNSQQSRGVSPAISVVLAVAITLVLAATVGAFVLGLGENTSEGPPSLSLSVDQQGDRIVLTHEAGETINTTNLRLTGVKGWGPSAQEFGAGDRISGTPKPGAERVDIVFETEDSASILRTADVSNIEVESLVVNDGFERGTGEEADGWDDSEGSTTLIKRSDEESLSGEYSMKYEGLTDNYGNRRIVSDPVDVVDSTDYEFGASYYLENPNTGDTANEYEFAVRIRWFDSGGKITSEDTKIFGDFTTFDQWKEVSFSENNVPSGATSARLVIDSKGDSIPDTNVYWDDTFIKEESP